MTQSKETERGSETTAWKHIDEMMRVASTDSFGSGFIVCFVLGRASFNS